MRLEILLPAQGARQPLKGFFTYDPDNGLLGGRGLIGVVVVERDTLAARVKSCVSAKEWDAVVARIQLLHSYYRSDTFGAETAIRKIVGAASDLPLSKNGVEDWIASGMGRDATEWVAAAEFIKRLAGATQLILWWDLDREHPNIQPGILCKDHLTALYVCAALRYTLSCPCCDVPFIPARPDQDYCSIRCRETFRKRRLRANQKLKQEIPQTRKKR